MAALLELSCAWQHATFRVRRAKSWVKQFLYALFYPCRIKKQICWLSETNAFQLALFKDIEDLAQSNLILQKAVNTSGPVEDPRWEILGWHITWKVLFTSKGNKQKKEFLTTEMKVGIY